MSGKLAGVNLTISRTVEGKWHIWLGGQNITDHVTDLRVEANARSLDAHATLRVRVGKLDIFGPWDVKLSEGDETFEPPNADPHWVTQDRTGNRPLPDGLPTPTVTHEAV